MKRLILGASTLALLSACGGAAVQPETQPEKPKEEAPKKDPRYAALPTPKPAPDWAPPAASKKTLKNGLTVWQMGGTKTPLVSIYLMLPTGGAADPADKAGLSHLTADLLDEGAGKYSALELSDKLGELATDYGAHPYVDFVLLSMDGLSENLEENLEILADIVRRPKLSKDEFERRKDHHLAHALTSRDNPGASMSRGVSRVLFGDGYAGAPPAGTVDSLKNITWMDVKKHAKQMTVPEGAHLTIAGMFDPEVAEKAVEKAFGTWRGKAKPHNAEVSIPSGGKNAYVIDFPGAAQSALAVVTQAGNDDEVNYFSEEVMNEPFGGSFTGRINMNLREDKGYTYGARGSFHRYREAGYFGIQTQVKSDTTGPSVKEIYSEITSLCSDRPLTDIERDKAVDGLLLGYPLRFDEVSSLGFRLVALPIHERETDFWQKWPTNIKAVTTNMANQAAKSYCELDRYSVIVAGDAASVTPELEKLGFTVTPLDRDGLPVKAEANETKQAK